MGGQKIYAERSKSRTFEHAGEEGGEEGKSEEARDIDIVTEHKGDKG